MFSLVILSKKCQECKYMATCDYKEMEEVGFLPLPENIEEAKKALSNGDSDVGFYGLDFSSLPDKTGLMIPLSYAKGFAKNHGISLYEALKQPMVEAYRQEYNGFMSPSLNMAIVGEEILFFYNHVEYVQDWFPCGQNKIRIQFKDGSQKVFTYANDITWNYESLDSFIERMGK